MNKVLGRNFAKKHCKECEDEKLKEESLKEELTEDAHDDFTHKLYGAIRGVVEEFIDKGLTDTDLVTALEFVEIHLGDEFDFDESLKEDKEEPKLETFEEKIDFLVKDEDEAIAGYDKILAMLDADKDANVIEQLTHLKDEEVAHKDFLDILKKDPSAIYEHDDKVIDEPKGDAEEIVDVNLDDLVIESKEQPKEETLVEDSHQEELGLPKEVTIDINSLVDDDVDLSGDDYNLDEVISDWLSDNYGFCHYGFNYDYDYDKDPDFVYVYDIDWDTSGSCDFDDDFGVGECLNESQSKFNRVMNILNDNETYNESDNLISYNEPEAIIGSFNLKDVKDDYADELDINFDNPSDEDFDKFINVANGEMSDGFNFDIMRNTKDNLKKLIDKYADDIIDIYDESLEEDTVKQGNKWVNKGKEGTHGEFKTKKEADAQRKAMFAKGYHEDYDDDFGFNHILEEDHDDIKVDWSDLEEDSVEVDDVCPKCHKNPCECLHEDNLEEEHAKTGHIKLNKPIELRARDNK